MTRERSCKKRAIPIVMSICRRSCPDNPRKNTRSIPMPRQAITQQATRKAR